MNNEIVIGLSIAIVVAMFILIKLMAIDSKDQKKVVSKNWFEN